MDPMAVHVWPQLSVAITLCEPYHAAKRICVRSFQSRKPRGTRAGKILNGHCKKVELVVGVQ